VSRNKNNKFILLTIDVEDWFQVENFKPWIPFNTWPSYELRIEKNTHRLLDLFDSITYRKKSKISGLPRSMQSQFNWGRSCLTKNPIKATFFILGWVAERLPHLVREIHSRGHEVASHGYTHNLCNECSSDELKADLIRSKKLLEDIIGDRVYGYRAPSFSINNDILKIMEDCGYLYDSSYNSFNLHGRYGKISLDGLKKNGIAFNVSETFFELPISNISFKMNPSRLLEKFQFCLSSKKKKILTTDIQVVFRGLKSDSDTEIRQKGKFYKNLVIPCGGGAYFRIIPSPLFKIGIKTILKKENAYLFYMHPWEIDPEQPRVNGASISYRFRHYINLNKTFSKLENLIEKLKDCHFITCMQYLTQRDL